MKTLTQHIKEGLRINKSTKENIKLKEYKYFPEDKNELQEILRERLKEDPNADLNYIDTSKITDMSFLFEPLDPHNINISDWDVSNVENMDAMFAYCKNFKGKGLEYWDVSNVNYMEYIFYECKNFNCNLGKWNVSKVKNMSRMFYECKNFDCDLSEWDVSNVEDMTGMFMNCEKFTGTGLSNWNVSKVRYMEYIFYLCTSLKNKPNWYK